MAYIYVDSEQGTVDLGTWQNNVSIPLYIESYSYSSPIQLAVEFCPNDGESPSLWINNQNLGGQCNLNSFEGWQNGSWVTVNGWEVSLCLGDYWGDDHDSRVILHYRVDPNNFSCADQNSNSCSLWWDDVWPIQETENGIVTIDGDQGDFYVDTLTVPHIFEMRDFEAGDWIEITMSSSQASNLKFAFEESYGDDGSSINPDFFLVPCYQQVKIHLRLTHSGILRFAPKNGTYWSCQAEIPPLDWMRVRQIQRFTLCTDVETCGCQHFKAYNYEPEKPFAGVCQFNIPPNLQRFNPFRYIDDRGHVRIMGSQELDSVNFPLHHHYVALSELSAIHGLTSEGILTESGEVLADSVRVFDANDIVVAARENGTLFLSGSSDNVNLGDIPLEFPGESIRQICFPYRISGLTAGVAILLESGHVQYYGYGNFNDNQNHQGLIVQLAPGPECTYYVTASGHFGEFAHSYNGTLPYLGANVTDVIDEHQGRIGSLAGTAYQHINYITESNVLFSAGSWAPFPASNPVNEAEKQQIIANKGQLYSGTSISLTTSGRLIQNGQTVGHMGIWTNHSLTSLVSPSKPVECIDPEACNYGEQRPCHYYDLRNQNRFDAGHASLVALDTLGRLHHWGHLVDTASSLIEGTMGLKEVRLCLNKHIGSSFDQFVLAIDSLDQLAMYDVTPDGTSSSWNANPTHYGIIPSEVQNKPILRIDKTLGRFAALAEDGTLAIWGSNYDLPFDNDDEAEQVLVTRQDVAEFDLNFYNAFVSYNNGDTESIVLRPASDQIPGIPEYHTMSGICPEVSKFPSPYIDGGIVVYENGQIATTGKSTAHEMMIQLTESQTPVFDLAPRLFSNPWIWYGIGARGEILSNDTYSTFLDDRLSNGSLAVNGQSAMTYRMTSEGKIEPLGYGWDAEGNRQFQSEYGFTSGAFCECNDYGISPQCSCEDNNGDGVCDLLLQCNPQGPDSQACIHCGIGTLWNSNTSQCERQCPADLNLDGIIGLSDILDLISMYNLSCQSAVENYGTSWNANEVYCGLGTTYEGPALGCQISCAPDVNGSDYIGLTDLLEVLSLYGQSCNN